MSQDQEAPEFLVTTAQDTLYGFVRETSNVVHIEQGLYFKPSKNADEILYLMKDVLAYGDDSNNLFRKRKIPKSKNDSTYQFLEVLFTGNVNLYQFRYEFYLEKDGEIYKLKNTDTEVKNKEGEMVRKYNKEYLKTLSMLLGDCYSIYDEISSSKLIYKDLIKIFENYHNCKNSDYKIYKDITEFNPILNFGAFIGGFSATNSNTFKTVRSRYIISGLNEQNFFFGIDFYLRPTKISRFYFVLSPQFSFLNQYNFTVTEYSPNLLLTHNLSYQFNQFDVPVGVGVLLNNKKIQPYINSGFVISHLWQGSYNYTLDRSDMNDALNNDSNDTFSNINILGFWASFGMKYHLSENISLYNNIRYQANNFFTKSYRVQGGANTFNYYQLKFDVGIMF